MTTTGILLAIACSIIASLLILLFVGRKKRQSGASARPMPPPVTLEQRADSQRMGGTLLVAVGFCFVVLYFFLIPSIQAALFGCFAILIGTLVIGFSQIRVR